MAQRRGAVKCRSAVSSMRLSYDASSKRLEGPIAGGRLRAPLRLCSKASCRCPMGHPRAARTRRPRRKSPPETFVERTENKAAGQAAAEVSCGGEPAYPPVDDGHDGDEPDEERSGALLLSCLRHGSDNGENASDQLGGVAVKPSSVMLVVMCGLLDRGPVLHRVASAGCGQKARVERVCRAEMPMRIRS
jgi:hypothetical protein